ncbi:MAG TPA: ClpX C4-type zinc finger protein [Vicinamibacterales bacterium]|nr:ClpX C4-type zinc finger protein [Vicinamibacterales bacterium]
MTTDPSLLEKARTAGAQLAEAERQVLVSRADYHTAIRRLHQAGSSLREIAEQLSLSHQRVQQIVNAAGGSWWQMWRGRRGTRDAVCTWCDRPPSEVAKLIAGPRVFICDECVTAAERQLARSSVERRLQPPRQSGATSRRCAFCSRRPSKDRSLAPAPHSICSDCLRACREILDSST